MCISSPVKYGVALFKMQFIIIFISWDFPQLCFLLNKLTLQEKNSLLIHLSQKWILCSKKEIRLAIIDIEILKHVQNGWWHVLSNFHFLLLLLLFFVRLFLFFVLFCFVLFVCLFVFILFVFFFLSCWVGEGYCTSTYSYKTFIRVLAPLAMAYILPLHADVHCISTIISPLSTEDSTAFIYPVYSLLFTEDNMFSLLSTEDSTTLVPCFHHCLLKIALHWYHVFTAVYWR